MATAFVSRKAASQGPTPSTSVATAAQAHTTGNLLVVCVSSQAGGESITDTAGNTYTVRKSYTPDTNRMHIYTAHNITGHASNVVTFSGTSAGYRILTVHEFSGDFGSSHPVIETTSGSGATTATLTMTSGRNAGIVAFYLGGPWSSAGTGFTGQEIETYFFDEYKANITSAQTATVNVSSGTPQHVALMFQEQAGGGGGNRRRRSIICGTAA